MLVGGIAWLAFSPNPPPEVTTGWDKSNHLLAFGALGFVAVRAFPAAPALAAPALLLGYGLLIEFVQGFVPGRSAEFADLLADAAGIALGALVARGWLRLRRT